MCGVWGGVLLVDLWAHRLNCVVHGHGSRHYTVSTGCEYHTSHGNWKYCTSTGTASSHNHLKLAMMYNCTVFLVPEYASAFDHPTDAAIEDRTAAQLHLQYIQMLS